MALLPFCSSVLPVLPETARSGDIGILGPLVTTAKQHHHRLIRPCVVHAIARPDIDSEFPHTVSTKPVIAEIAKLNSFDSPDDGDSRNAVFHRIEPGYEYVAAFGRKVVPDLEHAYIRL
jgi:hypothetical protein